MKPGDHIIWLRSPGLSFLTGWRVAEIPGIVVRVCVRQTRIRVLLDGQEKTVNVDPHNLINCREIEDHC